MLNNSKQFNPKKPLNMKITISFLLLFASLLSFGQPKNEDRDPQYQAEYTFSLIANNSTISMLTYKSPTLKETSLVLTTEIVQCKRFEGLTLVLTSGETLSFKNSKIDCEKLPNGKSKLTSTLLLTPQLYKQLSETELRKFHIGTVEVPVSFKEEGENFKMIFDVSKNN